MGRFVGQPLYGAKFTNSAHSLSVVSPGVTREVEAPSSMCRIVICFKPAFFFSSCPPICMKR